MRTPLCEEILRDCKNPAEAGFFNGLRDSFHSLFAADWRAM